MFAVNFTSSEGALNYLLGELERLGYLERRADPDDLRSKRIALAARCASVQHHPRGGCRSRDRLGEQLGGKRFADYAACCSSTN
jgi:Winged helix DNA-binding domain